MAKYSWFMLAYCLNGIYIKLLSTPKKLKKHYAISLQSSNAQAYTLLATAVGLQSRDTTCSSMRLQISENAKVLQTSNASLVNDAGNCWK
jgi:hypothetical protein